MAVQEGAGGVAAHPPAEDDLHVLRAAQVRVAAISASKNDRARCGASKTMVPETSTCRIEYSRQYLASRSLPPNDRSS